MIRLITALIYLLSLSVSARAESFLTLEVAALPTAVTDALAEVRSACKEAGEQPIDAPEAAVTILDLNRDGSKDILLRAWRACGTPLKGAGCNTAGCDVKIFKQVGQRQWKLIFEETVLADIFLSASKEGYFGLMAVSVSRKISDRCPDPSGSECDFLLYWKKNAFAWQRIR